MIVSQYPGKDGWSKEYDDFITCKHKEPLKAANSHDIMLNEVELQHNPEESGGICGYAKKLDFYIYLTLKPYEK